MTTGNLRERRWCTGINTGGGVSLVSSCTKGRHVFHQHPPTPMTMVSIRISETVVTASTKIIVLRTNSLRYFVTIVGISRLFVIVILLQCICAHTYHSYIIFKTIIILRAIPQQPSTAHELIEQRSHRMCFERLSLLVTFLIETV